MSISRKQTLSAPCYWSPKELWWEEVVSFHENMIYKKPKLKGFRKVLLSL